MEFITSIFRRERVVDADGVTKISEEMETMVDAPENPVWDTIVRWSMFLLVFLVPFWFLPYTAVPLEVNRLFLVSLLVIVGFIAWLGQSIYSGRIIFPRSLLLGALIVWIIALFLSSMFSVLPGLSFWGDRVASFFNLSMLTLVTFLAAATIRKSSDIGLAYLLLFSAAFLVAIFELVQLFFGFSVFPWDFAAARAFNPIGSWNSMGIFFGFILVAILPFLENARTTSMRAFFWVLALLSLAFAATVNFSYVWMGTGFVALVFLAYSFSRKGSRKMPSVLILLLASVLFFIAKNQIDILTYDTNGVSKFGVALEVTPNVSSTLEVAKAVLKERAVLGYGLGTFEYAWDLFKNPSFNASPVWAVRFSTGSSFVSTLLVTTGILGMLALLFVFVAFFWLGIRVVGASQDEGDRMFALSSFGSALFLLFMWFVYPITTVTAFLTFFSFGMIIALGMHLGILKESRVSILSDSAKGFVSALVIILFMVLGVVGVYVSGEKYFGSVFFGKGIVAFNDGNVNTAEGELVRAASFDGSKDQYLRLLAQVSFAKLQRIVQTSGDAAPEDVRNNFQLALSNAITNARTATTINPLDAVNWRLLGQIYEAVIPFVSGSTEAALDAYKKAAEFAPQNPAIRDDIARIYISQGNYLEARKQLEEALRLKGDYSPAHFRLAQISALKGNIEEATKNTENAAISAPNDIGILFQLGLLYFQQNRLDEARLVFERTVALNNNYSNARYFLGLTYGAQKDFANAIKQFEKIAELNPGNKEVEIILANLRENKDPLTGISPPAPPPATSGTPPLDDATQENSNDKNDKNNK